MMKNKSKIFIIMLILITMLLVGCNNKNREIKKVVSAINNEVIFGEMDYIKMLDYNKYNRLAYIAEVCNFDKEDKNEDNSYEVLDVGNIIKNKEIKELSDVEKTNTLIAILKLQSNIYRDNNYLKAYENQISDYIKTLIDEGIAEDKKNSKEDDLEEESVFLKSIDEFVDKIVTEMVIGITKSIIQNVSIELSNIKNINIILDELNKINGTNYIAIERDNNLYITN